MTRTNRNAIARQRRTNSARVQHQPLVVDVRPWSSFSLTSGERCLAYEAEAHVQRGAESPDEIDLKLWVSDSNLDQDSQRSAITVTLTRSTVQPFLQLVEHVVRAAFAEAAAPGDRQARRRPKR